MRPGTTGLTRQFRDACRRHTVQAAARPVVTVIHPPMLHHLFPLIDMSEQLAIGRLVTHSAIERRVQYPHVILLKGPAAPQQAGRSGWPQTNQALPLPFP